VGEGLLGASAFALRVVACGNAFSLRSNRTLIEGSRPSPSGEKRGAEHWPDNEDTEKSGGGGRITRRKRLALRVVACGNAFSLRSNRILIEGSRPSPSGEKRGAEHWPDDEDTEKSGGGGRITRRKRLRPSGRCLRQRFLATLESNLNRRFSSFPLRRKTGR
jgi:hypothetical protein